MKAPRHPSAFGTSVLSIVATSCLASPAFAWESKGHTVIEALAYRTLVEGHRGAPPRPDVLRDLINDGALAPPWCFGRGDDPPADCRSAPASEPAPLLAPAGDGPAGCLLPAPVQRFRAVLPLHGTAQRWPDQPPSRHLRPPRPRHELRRSLQRPPGRPPATGRRGRRARRATERLWPLRDDAHRGGLLLGCAHAAGARRCRLPPRLEADREDRRTLDRAREADSRRGVPQGGRPPGQDLRRRGRRGGLRDPGGPSVRRPLFVPLRGRGPRPAGNRRAPRRREGPACRAARCAPRDGHPPGDVAGLEAVPGEVAHRRPSLRGSRMRRPRAPRGRPRSVCLSSGSRHA